MTDNAIQANLHINDMMESVISDKVVRDIHGTPYLVMHANMQMKNLASLLPNPLRINTQREFSAVGAFAAYLNEFKGSATRGFATQTRGSKSDQIFTVVDYHGSGEDGKPSHCDHTALLTIAKDVDWLKWISMDGRAFNHIQLIDFLTDYRNEMRKFTSVNDKGQFEEREVQANIVLDMLRKLKVKHNSEDDSEVGNGGFSMAVKKEERVLADGKPWPEILTVALPVYDGMQLWELNFRVAYRGSGQFVLSLIRPEMVEKAAFTQVCSTVIDLTSTVIFGYTATQTAAEPATEDSEPAKPKRTRKAKEEAAEAEAAPVAANGEHQAEVAEPTPAPAAMPEPVAEYQATEVEAPAAPTGNPAPWAKPQE